MLDNAWGEKRTWVTAAAASFTIEEYTQEVPNSPERCSFSLSLTQKDAGEGPLPPLLRCSAVSLAAPSQYCRLLAISHSLLPDGELQLQLQDTGCLANSEIPYSDMI